MTAHRHGQAPQIDIARAAIRSRAVLLYRSVPALLVLAMLLPLVVRAQDAPEGTGDAAVVEDAMDVEALPETTGDDSAVDDSGAAATPMDGTAEENATETADPAVEPDEAPAVAEDSAPQPEPTSKRGTRWFRGNFEAEVDTVFADGDDDIDLSQYLRLDVDPPQIPRLHLRASLWLHQDLSSDAGKPNVLRDINDASSSDVQARILHLYAEIDNVLGEQSVLRIGRQRIQEGAAYNRIDGIYLGKRKGQFDWYGFLGARASIYRDTSQDPVLGGGVAYRPTSQTRIALDGYYAEEDRYGVSRSRGIFGGYRRPIETTINDSKVTLSIWHNFGPNTRVYGRIGTLGSDLDEMTLSLNGYIPRLDVLYDVNYRQLFNTTGDTTADLSRFYRVLGQYREQQTFYIGAHRPLTEKITLSLEGEIRDARNDDFYSGNRDYVRVGAALYVEDIYKKFDVSTFVEYWDASEGEGTWTITGEIRRKWAKVDWRAGVDYVRYKDRVVEYDQNAALIDAALVAFVPGIYPGFSYLAQANATRVVDTRENVYSIFTDLTWTFREEQEIFFKFSFEEDSGPYSPYWRTRVGYRMRF